MPIVEVEVDVSLSDFDTEDLLDELKSRGNGAPHSPGSGLPEGYDPQEGKGTSAIAEACYEARRRGDDARALELIDRLIYAAMGRVV